MMAKANDGAANTSPRQVPSQRVSVPALALQGAVAVVLVILFWSGGLSLGAMLAAAVFVLSIRLTAPLSCINFINAYWYVTYVVTPPFLLPQMAPTLAFHFAAIQSVITVAYWLSSFAFPVRLSRGRASPPPLASNQVRFAHVLTGAFVAAGAVLVLQVVSTGFAAFFSGAGAADRIAEYSTGSVMESLTRNGTLLTAWTFVALYILSRTAGLRFSRTAQAAGFVGVPIIGINRSVFVFNILFLAMTNRRRVSAPVIVAAILSILIVGLGFGYLRGSQLKGPGGELAVTDLLTGEFSSSVVYSELLQYPQEMPLQYGVPIVAPVLFAPVPRVIWPAKPDNGSAVYMKHFHPELLEAGYSYASNCLSDGLINFGMPGVFGVAALLGLIYGRVDQARLLDSLTVLDYILVFNIYTILRTAMAVSIMFVLVQLFILWVFRRYIFGNNRAKMMSHRDRRPPVRTVTADIAGRALPPAPSPG